MGDCLQFCNVSFCAAEVGSSRRLLEEEDLLAEMLFSRSASAKSCLMISPFSPFSAFLGLNARVFANRVNTARTVTTPMKMNTMLAIYAAVLTCPVKAMLYDRNCALAGAAGCRLPRLLSHHVYLP